MFRERQLFYNHVTQNALLIYRGVAHSLEGPFNSREEADRAAAELVTRIEESEAVDYDLLDP
jgi:hypothetical protein